MRYDAFISYKHGDDTPAAQGLQYSLQHLAKPWYRRRALEVFRDDTHMSAGDLAEKIQDGINESRYYLLIASPGSAASPWVGEEIKHWSTTKVAAADRMLIALVEGSLEWDKDAGQFDPERCTALHPELFGVFRGTPPLWIDLTHAEDDHAGGAASASPREFGRRHRTQVAKLAARIHEVELPAILDADQHEHRRTLRLAWSAVVLLALLTVAAIIGFVNAQRSADEARAQTRNAQSGELAARSGALLTTDPPLAFATAVAANARATSPLARDALQSAAALPVTGVFGPGDGATGTRFAATAASADGRRIATSDGTRVSVRDVATGTQIAEWTDRDARGVQELALDRTGRRLAVSFFTPVPAESDAIGTGRTVVWDVDAHRTLDTWDTGGAPLEGITFSPDGSTLAGGASSDLAFWNPETRTHTTIPSGLAVLDAAYNADGSRVLVAVGNSSDAVLAGGGTAQLWDPATGALLREYPVGTNATAIAFNPDGRTFATGDESGRVQLRDLFTGEAVREPWSTAGAIRHLAFNQSGSLLASGDSGGSVEVRNAQTAEVVAEWQAGTSVSTLEYVDGGRAVATGDDHGHVVVRDALALDRHVTAPTPVDQLIATGDGTDLVAFGRVKALDPLAQRTTAVRWDTAQGGLRQLTDTADYIPDAAISADGRRILLIRYAGASSDVSVLDTATGAVVDSWTAGGVTASALAPDGSFGVTAEFVDGRYALKVRALPTPELGAASAPSLLPTPTNDRTGFSRVSVAADHTILTVDQSGNLKLWKPDGTQQVVIDGAHSAPGKAPRFRAVQQVALSPDGRTVATVDIVDGQHRVHLWPAGGGRPTTEQCADTSTPAAVAFSPDGRMLAIGDDDHHVTLCTISDHRPIASWSVPGKVSALAFSADGHELAAGDDVGNISRWDTTAYLASTAALSNRLCRVLRGYHPTADEWKPSEHYRAYRDLCR